MFQFIIYHFKFKLILRNTNIPLTIFHLYKATRLINSISLRVISWRQTRSSSFKSSCFLTYISIVFENYNNGLFLFWLSLYHKITLFIVEILGDREENVFCFVFLSRKLTSSTIKCPWGNNFITPYMGSFDGKLIYLRWNINILLYLFRIHHYLLLKHRIRLIGIWPKWWCLWIISCS